MSPPSMHNEPERHGPGTRTPSLGRPRRGRRRRAFVQLAATLAILLSTAAQAQFDSFLHRATSTNTFLFATQIDHPALNNKPDARFAVTQVYNPQGAVSGNENNAFIGMRYSTSTGKWSIENQDLSTLSAGSNFFVLLGSDSIDGTVHQLTAGNTSGSETLIDDATMNSCTSGVFVATWLSNPGGGGTLRYDAPLIVQFDSTEGKWRVFNIGGVDLPIGGAISLLGVLGLDPGDCTRSSRQTISTRFLTFYEHDTSAGNVSGNLTRIPGNPNPFEFFFVSHTVGTAIPTSPIAVAYDFFSGNDTWAIQNLDPLQDMPVGAKFYVLQTRPLFWDGFETGNPSVWSSVVP